MREQQGAQSQLVWLWLTGLMIVLDQVSKHWVVARFDLYERLEVLPFFNLTLAYNSGAAFSFLAGAGGWQRWFFAAVAVIAVAALIFLEEQGVQSLSHYAYGLALFQVIYVMTKNIVTLYALGPILSLTEKYKQLGINALALAVMAVFLAWRF